WARAILFLNTGRERSELPPHPGPLPQGEGDVRLRAGIHEQPSSVRASSAPPQAAPLSSLSLRERAGVRGNAPSRLSGRPIVDLRAGRKYLPAPRPPRRTQVDPGRRSK